MIDLVLIAAGLVCLVWSSDRFIDGAAAIAHHGGLSPLLIGMTIVSLRDLRTRNRGIDHRFTVRLRVLSLLGTPGLKHHQHRLGAGRHTLHYEHCDRQTNRES